MRRGFVERPPMLDGVQRVDSLKILGVTFRSDLSASPHVNEVLGACSGSLHALRKLRSHGLSREALTVVAEATTISRLLYAAPAWWGYTTAADRQRLERFLAKTTRSGYLPEEGPTMEMRVGAAEDRLLKAIEWSRDHVLRRLFPPPAQRHYALRPRAHGFKLPRKDDKNFIPRVLYKHINNPRH